MLHSRLLSLGVKVITPKARAAALAAADVQIEAALARRPSAAA